MAPKKKGKKQDDDWEAELGETIAPVADTADAPPPADDDEPAAGGLMALLRKKKEKRKAKGLSEDFPAEEPQQEEPAQDLTAKAAVEADLDDEFALPEKKGKGGKGKQQPAKAAADDETDASGRVLTKAEKEKAKKEREKQRKKEQVSAMPKNNSQRSMAQKKLIMFPKTRLPRRSPPKPRLRSLLRPRKRRRPPLLPPLPPPLLSPAARNYPRPFDCSKSNKKHSRNKRRNVHDLMLRRGRVWRRRTVGWQRRPSTRKKRRPERSRKRRKRLNS